MKSYNDLYKVAMADETREIAIHNVLQSARNSREFRFYAKHTDKLSKWSKNWIRHYKNSEHNPIIIYDGITRKQRTIIVPTFRELVVQHCIVEALKPMFWRGMYRHSYASIPRRKIWSGNKKPILTYGSTKAEKHVVYIKKYIYDIRGSFQGKKFIERWLKDVPNTQYVLKMDIKHFFDSIPHDILKNKLKKKIKDKKMLQLLFDIIDITDIGLPLGFYTSQWLSNWYLQDLDHYIKEQLGAKYYMRYMDDMVIFDADKKKLHKMRMAVEEYLNKTLGLQLKENWQVFKFVEERGGTKYGRDLDFMGFRFYRNRTIIRKTILYRCTRKSLKINKKDKMTLHDCRQILSYNGYLKYTDTYNTYLKWIKPNINFGYIKNRISSVDKRDNNKQGGKK